MLVFDHGGEHIVEGGLDGDRDDIVARHHDFADGEFAQVQHAVDHVFLGFRQISQAAAGGDNQFQFLRRVAAGAVIAAADPQGL